MDPLDIDSYVVCSHFSNLQQYKSISAQSFFLVIKIIWINTQNAPLWWTKVS